MAPAQYQPHHCQSDATMELGGRRMEEGERGRQHQIKKKETSTKKSNQE